MVAELHTWEQVDKLAAKFDEVYADLKESLDSGVPKLERQDPEICL